MKLKKLFLLLSFVGLSTVAQKTYSEDQVVEDVTKEESNIDIFRKEVAKKIVDGVELTQNEFEFLNSKKHNIKDIVCKLFAGEELTTEEHQFMTKHGKYAAGAGAGIICFYLVPPIGLKAVGQVAVKSAVGALGGYSSINFATKLSKKDLNIQGLQTKFKEYFKPEEPTDSEKKS